MWLGGVTAYWVRAEFGDRGPSLGSSGRKVWKGGRSLEQDPMHCVLPLSSDLGGQKEFRASVSIVPRHMWLPLGQLPCFGRCREKIRDLHENDKLCAEPLTVRRKVR